MKRNLPVLAMVWILVMFLSGCSDDSSGLHSGYYSAEAASFDTHGWKEYITIYVSNNTIVTVEYNARNASGFIKSWDMEYMREMMAESGAYPNQYARGYAVSLLNWQDAENIDAIAGATHSYYAFQLLTKAAIDQSKAGDKQMALVEIPEVAEEE